MKIHLIVAAAAGLLVAGCGNNNSGGGTSPGSAEESTGQGLNAQTQESRTIQPGTTSNMSPTTSEGGAKTSGDTNQTVTPNQPGGAPSTPQK